MRLNRAMIYVSDVPRMTAFYAGTLGLKPIEETREDGYVEFETGSSTFALTRDSGCRTLQDSFPSEAAGNESGEAKFRS